MHEQPDPSHFWITIEQAGPSDVNRWRCGGAELAQSEEGFLIDLQKAQSAGRHWWEAVAAYSTVLESVYSVLVAYVLCAPA